jgi:protocatechuate 3,4-dioxygenase, beta subunit
VDDRLAFGSAGSYGLGSVRDPGRAALNQVIDRSEDRHVSSRADSGVPQDGEAPVPVDPPLLYPDYVSTRTRAPERTFGALPRGLTELTGPVFGEDRVVASDADLTRQHLADPIGERIIVSGRVVDSDGRPVRGGLIEIWQANAAGRYAHEVDDHPAPLDPNFTGTGRCLTDGDGGFRFLSIKPGAYPWRNHPNAWRPAHIHFSLFGHAFTQRLVTQMYFPGDPLLPLDPIWNSVPDADGRARLLAGFDLDRTVPQWALAYRFDIVLRGRGATPFETDDDVD